MTLGRNHRTKQGYLVFKKSRKSRFDSCQYLIVNQYHFNDLTEIPCDYYFNKSIKNKWAN